MRDCYAPRKIENLVKLAEIMKFALTFLEKNNHSIAPVIHGQSWSYPCRFGFPISNVMQRSNECMP